MATDTKEGATVPVPEIAATAVDESTFLLDVREDDEWQAGHAPAAVHVPMGQIVGRLDEVPAGVPIAVICRVGSRSAQVAEYLSRLGRDAANVDGGMVAWARAGLPMESSTDAPPQVI
jgi:rhodanese-related sulfurtransferase